MGAGDVWEAQRRLPPAGGIDAVPAIELMPAGAVLWRIHRSAVPGDGFSFRVPGRYSGRRFDNVCDTCGWLYAADSFQGAVAEAVLRHTPLVDVGERVVPMVAVTGRAVSVLRLTREMPVVSLRGAGAEAVGQGLWLTKSDSCDYPLTREWGAALRVAAPECGGSVWRARFDEESLACVLFSDRASGALVVASTIAIDREEGLEAVRRVLLDHRAVIEE